jgi:DnaJ homolog subfamily C member 17
LITAAAVCALLSPFGALDADSAVLSLKPSASKPKRAVALVPFDQVVAAFAAVGASGRKERGLEGIEVSWAGGSEPELIEWLRKSGKLGSSAKNAQGGGIAAPDARTTPVSTSADASKSKLAFTFASGGGVGAGSFSSFASTFVSLSYLGFASMSLSWDFSQPDLDAPPTSSTSAPVGGLDLEAITLLRMRQAERERLEQEIREQEEAEL